jgi:cytochrome P450
MLTSPQNAGPLLDPSLNRHPDYGFEVIWHLLSTPPVFLVDMTPIDYAFLVITHPTPAETIAQPSPNYKYSTPKSDTMQFLHRLIGLESMITAEGEEWKNLRRRFNKGFSPQHLHSLSPLVMAKTSVFVERLRWAAASKKEFLMKGFAQDLTTDIITEISIEKDFESQTTEEGRGEKGLLGVLTASRVLSALVFKAGQGFDPVGYFDMVRPVKSWFYEKVFDWKLYYLIRRRLEEQKVAKSKAGSEKSNEKNRSITHLALEGMEATPALIRNTVAQLKSFLFAGQDTTATLIQWICFELAQGEKSEKYRRYLEKMKKEHDQVFGDDPWSALEALADPEKVESIIGDKLPYTTAWVKETLRLHPPAGTARWVPPVSDTVPPFEMDIPVVDENGKTTTRKTQINGLRIYTCQFLLHRNKDVWGEDALEFNPDRWMDEEYVAKLPTGAWRPFERGPRNCIGQTLALIEGVIVLCAVTRGFSFEKVGLDGDRVGNGDLSGGRARSSSDVRRKWVETDMERQVWTMNQVTAVPLDGMKMKVRLRV